MAPPDKPPSARQVRDEIVRRFNADIAATAEIRDRLMRPAKAPALRLVAVNDNPQHGDDDGHTAA